MNVIELTQAWSWTCISTIAYRGKEFEHSLGSPCFLLLIRRLYHLPQVEPVEESYVD